MSMSTGSQLSGLPIAFAPSERPRSPWVRQLAMALARFNPAAGICEFVRRRQLIHRLSRLVARELADMGIMRADVYRIYEPDFAERRRS